MPKSYIFIVNVISCVLLALTSMAYTTWVDNKREANERESDRQWCELVIFYDDFYQSQTEEQKKARTELAKRQAELMHHRRLELGCK